MNFSCSFHWIYIVKTSKTVLFWRWIFSEKKYSPCFFSVYSRFQCIYTKFSTFSMYIQQISTKYSQWINILCIFRVNSVYIQWILHFQCLFTENTLNKHWKSIFIVKIHWIFTGVNFPPTQKWSHKFRKSIFSSQKIKFSFYLNKSF